MTFSWKSNYKLPLSFIVFFVLMFFLIGEQLTALPTYLVGSQGSDTIHILDKAPADALHRPIAYLVIALVIWALLRYLNWKVAYITSGILWQIDQWFLTPNKHPDSEIPGLPGVLPTVIATFIFWGLLVLGPYFLYRWIDKKWGIRGILKSMLILFLINLVLLIFFAYQIFYLHNSHRSLPKDAQRLPPNTCPEKLTTEKDKPTMAYWNGQAFEVGQKQQLWIEQNCPGALGHP